MQKMNSTMPDLAVSGRRLARIPCPLKLRTEQSRFRFASRRSFQVPSNSMNGVRELNTYIQHCLEKSNVTDSFPPKDVSADVEYLKCSIDRLQSCNDELRSEMDQLSSQLINLVSAIEKASSLHSPSNPETARPAEPRGLWKRPRAGTIEVTSRPLRFPGATIANSSNRWQDEEALSVTSTVEATATAELLGAKRGHLDMDALEALATHAVVRAAERLARRRTERLRLKGEPHVVTALHADTYRVLAFGEVIAAQQNPVCSPFGHESFVCELADPQSGRKLRAIFKPRVPGDSEGWHRPPMEVVAYRLNRLLGMDLVPPAAYRSYGVTLPLSNDEGGGTRWFAEGAMIFWADEAQQLSEVAESEWSIPKDILLSDTRVLDVLLHNSDRHSGHFLMARHWALGHWETSQGFEREHGSKQWHGTRCCVLIDHAASFRAEAEVCCTHENAFKTGPMRHISARTLLLLKLLHPRDLAEAGADLLTGDEIVAAMARRDAILSYIDDLVDEQGYEATVIG